MAMVRVNPIEQVVQAKEILSLAAQIVRGFSPLRVVLFGSYAYGNPTPDSDVDLLVVTRYAGPANQVATRIRLSVEVSFPMDILVRSPAEIERSVKERDWFFVDVMEKGIVLHDRSNPAMGSKGRSRLRRRLAAAKIAQG